MENDWKIYQSEYGNKVAFWNSAGGWYDVYQGDKFLCWAAVSTNMLLWWYDLNQEKIDKYISSHPDFEFPDFVYDGKGCSGIFSYFEKFWPDNGNQPTFGLNWFLTGNSNIGGGALFKEVFEGKDVTYRSSTVNKATFNSVITEALENRKIISIDITSYGAHVITIWGTSYGNDGFIQGLYLTDSAVSNEIYGVDAGGLQYSEVVYQNGKPFVYYNGGNNSAPVVTLYTFSSCQDIWSLY